MRAIKIQDEKIYPDGQWVKIAYEEEKNMQIDDEVYHYVDKHDVDLDNLKVGDTIELDETFKIMEVGEEIEFDFDSEIDRLQSENDALRDKIGKRFGIGDYNDDAWLLINELIENEIQQEDLCGR